MNHTKTCIMQFNQATILRLLGLQIILKFNTVEQEIFATLKFREFAIFVNFWT